MTRARLTRARLTRARPTLPARAAALSLVVLLGATACSGDDEGSPDGQTVPDSFLSDDADPVAEDGLPDGFPRRLVPLVEGQVVSADQSGPEGSHAVTVLAPSATAVEAATEAARLLEEAGWDNRSDEPIVEGATSVAQFFARDDGSLTILNVSETRGDAAVSYGIQLR